MASRKFSRNGIRESSVQPHPHARFRKRRPDPRQDTPEDADRSPAGRRIARPQHRGTKVLLLLVVEAHETQQRQIAPRVIVAVEEGQLLRAVRGIIRDIQVEGDELGAAMQPVAMALDHTIGQRFAHPVKLFAVGSILETADRRLRRQVLAFNGIAPDQHLVHGVFGQPRRIIGVGITTGNTEDALPQQLLGFHGQLCLVDACLSSRLPAPQSVESAGRQPSRGSRRHRNSLAAGQTAQPPASEKYRETTNTVWCFSRSTESLLVWFKPA